MSVAAGTRGSTLVELLVVLAIVGTLLGLGTLSFRRATSDIIADWQAAVAAGRARSAQTGRPVRLSVPARVRAGQELGETLLLLPDGRVLGRGLDPLTGAPHVTPRTIR